MSPTVSTKTVKTKKGAKEFSKSETEWVDVMDTLQHAISIIEKETAKNHTFLQTEIDTGNTSNAMVDHRRFMRKHSRPRWDRAVPLKLGTSTTGYT